MNQNEDTEAFLNERREKLGGELIFRSYATWYGRSDGDERGFGVFMYSDGNTLVIEDFERTPTLFGIRYSPKRKSEYVKLEIFIPLRAVQRIDTVTRTSAESSVRHLRDEGKEASLFARLFRKTVTRMVLDDVSYYIETADTDKLRKLIGR